MNNTIRKLNWKNLHPKINDYRNEKKIIALSKAKIIC